MQQLVNNGRRTYLTDEEKAALTGFINDNGGIAGAIIKLKFTRWHTLNDIVVNGYCSPANYKKLNNKIFKKLQAAA